MGKHWQRFWDEVGENKLIFILALILGGCSLFLLFIIRSNNTTITWGSEVVLAMGFAFWTTAIAMFLYIKTELSLKKILTDLQKEELKTGNLKCPNCGREESWRDASFCPRCGKQLIHIILNPDEKTGENTNNENKK
jgi:predicted RNA-binding Zn-ribbon protein involved in translation (DUF1610 family)